VKPKKSPPRKSSTEEAVTLSLRIQPRASKNEILSMEDGRLKVRLTAPPVDGAANEALVKFLAGLIRVAKSRVEIVSGHTGRDKVVRITGISSTQADQLLNTKRE
jgi:uncharacterized protein (TIGR00251 family)